MCDPSPPPTDLFQRLSISQYYSPTEDLQEMTNNIPPTFIELVESCKNDLVRDFGEKIYCHNAAEFGSCFNSMFDMARGCTSGVEPRRVVNNAKKNGISPTCALLKKNIDKFVNDLGDIYSDDESSNDESSYVGAFVCDHIRDGNITGEKKMLVDYGGPIFRIMVTFKPAELSQILAWGTLTEGAKLRAVKGVDGFEFYDEKGEKVGNMDDFYIAVAKLVYRKPASERGYKR